MIEIKKVLYPTDFSENADQARPYATELAKRFGAEVLLLHVTPAQLYPPMTGGEIDFQKIREDIENSAEKSLKDVASKMESDGVRVEALHAMGRAFVEIVRIARESKSDLIVLCTHGRGAVPHMLMGSTAERVVRKAPCPVLTVHASDHNFVHP